MTLLEQTSTSSPAASAPRGLTSAEVQERIRRGAVNDFKPRASRTYWEIARENIFNLFNITLGSLLVIVWFFQDYATLFFAGISVVTNAILGTIQEISAKRQLERLAALNAKEARVWRDGSLKTIPIEQIVVDDLVAIQPGDRMAVDGIVLDSDALEMDESHLTGEADAVPKMPNEKIVSGSFCIAGSGTMRATHVGKESTVNQLAITAKAYRRVLTPTQERVNAFVELSVLVMFVLGPALFISGYINELGLYETVKNAVVMVLNLVPQGLVLVTTLSLTIGAVKISRHKTLIQRVNAVESVYYADVLCFDKTGTLTRNQLHVHQIIPLNGYTLDDVRLRLYDYISSLSHQNQTAQAIADYTSNQLPNGHTPPEKLQEVPFASIRKWGAVAFAEQTLLLGAADRLLSPHTGNGSGPTPLKLADDLSDQGLRVLAFATLPSLPAGNDIDVSTTTPIALIVLSDSVRDDIQDTLNAFRAQDVDLKVISGDNLKTVKAIATQAGIAVEKAYTGDEIDAMSEAELDGAVRQANLFARITPETKRRIIAALKRSGHYVAMVGDGVNDVPALKESNLAVVMNDGAQIAKDVADIILLNNAMSTLPKAFEEGRGITRTVFGTTKLFLSKNAYATLLLVLVGVMSLAFPITPVQISWVTFCTANLHAALYAFGLTRPAEMKQFRRDVMDYVIITGVTGAVFMGALYFFGYVLTDENLNAGRSALSIYMMLYGLLIFWQTQGIELTRPRTLIQYKWTTILAGGFAMVGLLGFYIAPGIFEFVRPTLPLILLIVGLFLANVTLLELAMRSRHSINQLWHITEA